MNIETNKKKKQIAILGSTGSIGTQALQVIEEHPDLYEAYALTANNRVELLIAQARKFQPEVVVIANEEKYTELKEALSDLPIKVYAGTDAICQIVEAGPIDMVLTAMVGYAGLKPTMNAIRAKKAIALANKETLVVAGELINELAQQYRTPILPVDSEHSAVFQCLAGEVGNPIEKVILTASGGPFRTCTLEQLKSVTKTQALKHPNWEMGAKITIDSASMMNKGFEVIEAKWLFGVQPSQIEVVVHPQYHNIVFTGRYTVDQIPFFVEQTDVLLNLYENDEQQKLAMTVKLYDGIRYGLPMLISKGSYMGELMQTNDFVYVTDVDEFDIEAFKSWYQSLNKECYPYSSEYLKIQKDDERFESRLLAFAKE